MADAIWAGICEFHPSHLCVFTDGEHSSLSHVEMITMTDAEIAQWLFDRGDLGGVQIVSRSPLDYVYSQGV